MKIQLIRNSKGQLRGLALMLGAGKIETFREGEGAWRTCDCCQEAAAIVFCQRHATYLCSGCLPEHTVLRFCVYLSVAAARQLMQEETRETTIRASR